MSKPIADDHNGDLWGIQGSSCGSPLQDKQVQSWDVRAAVCAVGCRNIDAHSDEVLVFLLRNAVDKQTLDDLFNELFRRNRSRVDHPTIDQLRALAVDQAKDVGDLGGDKPGVAVTIVLNEEERGWL